MVATFTLDELPGMKDRTGYEVGDVIEIELRLRITGVDRVGGDVILQVGEPERTRVRHVSHRDRTPGPIGGSSGNGSTNGRRS
jgi:hypothetical protein